ncbi:MAG: penicillin-binding protein activator [Hyphomicrobiaceae bacterium]
MSLVWSVARPSARLKVETNLQIGTRAKDERAMAAPEGVLSNLFLSRRGLLAALLGVSSALAGCSTNVGSSPEAGLAQDASQPSQRKQAVKIAMVLPIAGYGQTAIIGKSLKQAGELALFERDDPSVQLIVKDDRGTPEGARAAVEEALRDGAEIILGPLFSASVTAAAGPARAARVPILAFSNDPRSAGNGVYLMSFLAAPEVERIVSHAAQRGKRRIAALIPADAYGDMVEPAFRQALVRAGGSLVHIERYPLRANAMLEPVKRVAEAIRQAELAGAPVDALFLPGGQDSLPQLAPLLTYNGIDTQKVKLIGTGAWDYPNVGREQALAGGWYPSPDPRAWQDFSARFAKTFGSAPPRIASLAYDAVSLAIQLADAPPGQRYTTERLTRASGFQGVDGAVALNANGTSQRGLAVLEIQPFGSTVIDPAPFGNRSSYPAPGAIPVSSTPPPVTGSVAGAPGY